MSADQVKKRNKRRKRDDDDSVPSTPERASTKRQESVSPDIQMHIEKEHETGGHWCAKVVFFLLLSVLVGLIALIVLESRGISDVSVSEESESRFSQYFEGWVEEPKEHDDHDDHSPYHAVHSQEEGTFEEEDLDHDDDGDETENATQVSQEAPDNDDEDDNDNDEEASNDREQDNDDDEEDNDDSPAQVSQEAEDDDDNDAENDGNNDNDDDDDEGNPDNDDNNDEDDRLNDDDDDNQNVSPEADPEDDDDDDEPRLNIVDGDLPFDEDDINSQETVFDNDVGEEIYLKKLKDEAEAARSREEAASNEPKQSSDDDNANDDPLFDDDFFKADAILQQSPKEALKSFEKMLKYSPTSLGAQLGKARALDRLSKVYKSNELLREAVEGYEKLITDGRLLLKNQSLYVETAGTCIDRMRFLGLNKRAVIMQKYLVKNFPDEVAHRNQLAILLIISNQLEEARRCLHETLLRWRDNGLALVHYGFVVKQLGGDLNVAAGFLREGIETNAEGTQDGLFYLTLGDTLIRLGRAQEAAEVFSRGADKKLFLSPHQRSLYNVPRLQSRSFWTLTETTYEKDLAEIKRHWQTIAEEGVRVLEERKLFLEEAENLRERGDWKQFELFSRGRKVVANCEKTPRTCALIDKFEASKCSRGQVKFSVMLPGTHVWPHCGPTNCRLRAHLGLVVPPLTHIRVVNETRSWKAGEWLIFDDSFEHEVWHNGTSTRLVLIVDMWHPDLTADERRSLAPI